MSGDLHAALARIVRTPRLLVACDYDGVLAPIVADRMAAKADPGGLAALRALAGLAQTDAAVISGRALSDLASRLGPLPGVEIVGSHGAERASGPANEPREREAMERLVEEIAGEVRAIAASAEGLEVEHKPMGVALHYRRASRETGANAARLVEGGPGSLAGVRVVHGKMVVELLAGGVHKGRALHDVRRERGATAVVFIGDDRTDEDAFAVLGREDAGVHVGGAETAAGYRVGLCAEVGPLLRYLAEARAAYLREIEAPRICEHSMLSDQRTIALVDPRGRVAWACFPRIDSPALFGALLGGPSAGSFDIAPERTPAGSAAQSYAPDAMTLRTDWGGLVVHDYLDCGGGRSYQRAGRSDLVRVVEGGRASVRFAPRPDFGRGRCTLRVVPGGLLLEGVPDPAVLVSPGVKWTILREGGADTAVAVVDATAAPVVLELRYGTANLRAWGVSEPERRAQSERPWSLWARTLRLPAVASEAVRRSALVLKALVHGPTGAVAAAGTTSLPEWPGGERNWDYRYCWPRDAFLAAGALVRLGNTGHAMKLMDWLLGILDEIGSPERLRPIYTVTGQDLGPEAEISTLRGYAGSRPVRVGNAAAGQVQLDVFGPIVETAWLLSRVGASLSHEHMRIVERVVDAVERRWAEPDHGIWELRLPPRHHVHSRTMCWFAVDRGIGVAEEVLGHAPSRWSVLREAIRRDVLEHGFDERLGAFTTAYGVAEIDAAALAVGLTGLVARDDARWQSTVRAVGESLLEGTTVRRYRFDDGIPGREGGWHLCTGWYIESLAGLGRHAEATALFEAMLASAGPTGLLAEQHCPWRGVPLGNVPQAYSHTAVIRAALALGGA